MNISIDDYDEIMINMDYIISFVTILEDYFDTPRQRDITCDYWSLTRLFNEYGELLSDISNKIENVNDILKNKVKHDKKESDENVITSK